MLHKLICIAILGIMFCPLAGVTAQDSPKLGQTLDNDGSLIIHYPDDWLAEFVIDNQSHAYRLFNTMAASAAFDSGSLEALEAGQMVLEIIPSSESLELIGPFPPTDILLMLLTSHNLPFDAISELEIAGRPAAVAQFTHSVGDASLRGLAVATTLENEDTVTILAEGKENTVEDASEIIFAIVAAVTSHVYEPLALPQAYHDGTIIFNYPEGWLKCDCDPSEPVMIIGSKGVPADLSWEFDFLNGGVLVTIFKDVEQWRLYNGQKWLSTPTPAKIIETYFLPPDALSSDIIEFELNGRPAARLRVVRPNTFTLDAFFIVAELETGRFGGLMALKDVSESFFATQATLLAIVDSMAFELDAQAYVNRAYTYMAQGQNQAAITDLTQAIRSDPEYAAAYYLRGIAYSNSGEYSLSIADFSQAITLEPEIADGYYARGTVFSEKGEYDRAIADFSRAIELDPQSFSAYNNRGVIYDRIGETELAVADYTAAIELYPEFVFAYNNRGKAYAHLGDLERAIADFTEAIELDSKYTLAYLNRGRTYRELGDFEQAIADYAHVIELQPNESAYLSRGYTYTLMGNSEQALADYVQYARLNETERIERAPLSAGQSIELGVIEGRSYLIPLNTAVGSTISITASTSEGDPLLILFDSHGEALTFNDDIRADDSNAAITDFSLPAGQDFQLLVTHAGGGSTFIATITLEQE